MSLSWANKFAKSALLNAQKRIDSVLDIKDAENVEDGDLTYNAATAESGDGGESSFMTALDDEASRDLSISAVDVDPSDNHAPSTSAVDESSPKLDATSRSSKTRHMSDVDLSVPDSMGWQCSPVDGDEATVVESEPNPIRDTHEPGATLLHYSPSSGSPDEDEASAAATQRAQDDETTTPGNDADTTPFDLSMIRAETPEADESRERVEHHEDVATVASSDIVVIKNVDDWSIASSSNRRGGGSTSDAASLAGVHPSTHHHRGASSSSHKNGTSSSDESVWHERVTALEAKLKHRDSRLAELSRLNSTLQTQNTTLTQRNKQMNDKLSADSKLQKMLAEKDDELRDLMDEGQKLSVKIAKQNKELKRLRDIEKAYESDRVKLDEVNQELERRDEFEAQITEKMKRLQSTLVSKEDEINRERKRADDTLNVADDLKMSEQRVANQRAQLALLEQRVNEFMITQRTSAEQFAASNAPLLANIEDLERKLRDCEAEKYVVQKKLRYATEAAETARKQSTDELTSLRQQLETMRTTNASMQERLTGMQRDLAAQQSEHTKRGELLASVETRLLAEQEELKATIARRDDEIAELKHELLAAAAVSRSSTATPAVTEKRDSPADVQPMTADNDEHTAELLRDLGDMERDNEALRQKLRELQHAHDTLLELHGESVVRIQELEAENESIKAVCKEQALMVAAMSQSTAS